MIFGFLQIDGLLCWIEIGWHYLDGRVVIYLAKLLS